MTPAQYRSRREKLGLTQSQLADLLDVRRETIGRREAGTERITREAQLAIQALAPRRRL